MYYNRVSNEYNIWELVCCIMKIVSSQSCILSYRKQKYTSYIEKQNIDSKYFCMSKYIKDIIIIIVSPIMIAAIIFYFFN